VNGFPLDFANIASWLTSFVVLAACVMLWAHRKNVWALLALGGEAAVIGCHLFLLLTPNAFSEFPPLRVLWPAAGLMFAVGLAGYAWNELATARRDSGIVQ